MNEQKKESKAEREKIVKRQKHASKCLKKKWSEITV